MSCLKLITTRFSDPAHKVADSAVGTRHACCTTGTAPTCGSNQMPVFALAVTAMQRAATVTLQVAIIDGTTLKQLRFGNE